MATRFASVTNKKISQIIKKAVPEIYTKKVTKFGLEVLTSKALSFLLEFIDKTGANLQIQKYKYK